ncbi:tetratricopeptide repeat protein [Clostridium sp. ZS2-4]|uniref:tetratricopeptide repeat protein n=1 Tax=Clostridium sp. ZS2-4 TaxID=2987703 RepID=UPI00227D3DA9|nr:tetratricopeptide repeat protein [Clostridium sp. ZS2-4]MCY6355925.1 tetratricopeptide repeat protein [Clostridium sp. ZS2-4]
MLSKEFIKKSVEGCLISSIFTGCGSIASSTEVIQAPKAVISSAYEKNYKNSIVQKFLPKGMGMVLSPPRAEEQTKAVIKKDITGDGKEEIIFTFKSSKDSYIGGVIVLMKENDEWKVALRDYGEGESVYKIDFADMDGDKKLELLVSSFVGGSVGNKLKIYKFENKKVYKFDLLGMEMYKKMDIEDMPDKEGKKDGKEEIALWVHDTGSSYFIEILRYVDGGLVEAEDVYPYYFKKVVSYYKEQLKDKDTKESPYAWYHLADSQVKADMPKEALKSLDECMKYKGKLQEQSKIKEVYPDDYIIQMIKGEALYKLKDYQGSIEVFNKTLEMMKKQEDSVKENRVRIYYDLGNSEYALGNRKKAKEYYNTALKVAEEIYSPDELFKYSYKIKEKLE